MDNNFKPQPENLEANNYNGTTGQTLGTKDEQAVAQSLPDAKNNLTFDGNSSVLHTGTIQDKDFQSGIRGFRLKSNGEAEFNQGTYVSKQAVTSTHFYKVLTDSTIGISLWMGDGTTGQGNLSGTAGDILFNGGSHKPEYCTGTTNWSALV